MAFLCKIVIVFNKKRRGEKPIWVESKGLILSKKTFGEIKFFMLKIVVLKDNWSVIGFVITVLGVRLTLFLASKIIVVNVLLIP